jgi:ABC-type glycerol-3-phosphate transport system substrate-binding protein
VLPLEDQFHSGFYNKAWLQKAGLDGPPQDWSELYAACTKLRAAGVEPMLYGSDSQALSSEFHPFYDLSYMMAGAYGSVANFGALGRDGLRAGEAGHVGFQGASLRG